MYCEILCFRIMGWFISHLWVNYLFIFRPEFSRPVPKFPENFPTRPEYFRIFPTRPEFPDNLHLCYN